MMLRTFALTWWRSIVSSAPRSAWLGVGLLLGLAALGLWAPLSSYPVGQDVDPLSRSLGCSAAHWLGTDHLGRDVFWRLLLAARAFVGPGLLSCTVTLLLAVPLGAAAGWAGGWTGACVRTLLGSISSIPRLVFVLLCCTIFGNDLFTLAVASGISATPALSSAIIGRIERLRSEEFVLASIAHGLSAPRILFVHLVALACGRSIARALVSSFGAFMVLECTLSYLGRFGVQEPMPSWGNMLAFEWGRDLGASVLAPGFAIWGTLGACALAARLFAETDDG